MFECDEAIGLLQQALYAADDMGSLRYDDDFETTVRKVHISVQDIIIHCCRNITGKEAIEQELLCNEKLHAAIFFTTLRYRGIISYSADEFYSSILDRLPDMSVRFYMDLTFKCDWSEYFIKCAAQLPAKILYNLLEFILKFSSSTYEESYVWHLSLQTIIVKLLNVPYENENSCNFDFNFTDVLGDSDNESLNEKEVLKKLFIRLSNCVARKMKTSRKTNVIKVLFHAVKTLLKYLISECERDLSSFSQLIDSFIVFKILREYILIDIKKGTLKVEMKTCHCTVIYHAFATTSWNICLNYLAFILDYYTSMLQQKNYKWLGTSPLCDIIMLLNSYLHSLNLLYISKSSLVLDERFKMLQDIIKFDFQASSVAAKIILQSDPNIIKTSLLQLVCDNSHVIDLMNNYTAVIDCIHTIKHTESKFKLLKVLHQLLLQNDIKLYDDVLNHILSYYGITDEFKLPDFEEKFLQFIQKTPSVHEAEKIIPPLLVQNPLTVMKYLIDQVLMKGPLVKVFIQILKHFQQTCLFSEKNHMPFLCGILNRYFEKTLEVHEYENIPALYELLAEVQVKITILPPDYFLRNYIIHKPDDIMPEYMLQYNQIYIILECIHIILPAILANSYDIEMNTFTTFLMSCGRLIKCCIERGNGKMKSYVVSILKQLEISEKKNKKITDVERNNIWFDEFMYFSEMVCAYLTEFLPDENVDFSSKSFLWTWFCKNENLCFFEEKFSVETLSYPVLLSTLIEVLPHFTKEEWFFSLKLLEICFENDILKFEALSHSQRLFDLHEADLDTYAAIACITKSLHFIIKKKTCHHFYVGNCFADTLMKLMFEGHLHLNTLMATFVDVCHLVQHASHLMDVLELLFWELKDLMLNFCSSPDEERQCKTLFSDALNNFPDSAGKYLLSQILHS